jgi:hypothetical protein
MVQRCGDEVREEITLAKARADFQDQELQKKEREAASGYRRKFKEMLSGTGKDLDTIKEWQLQQEKRRSGMSQYCIGTSFRHSLLTVLQKNDGASCSIHYLLTTISLPSSALAKSGTAIQHNGHLRQLGSAGGRTALPRGSGAPVKVGSTGIRFR